MKVNSIKWSFDNRIYESNHQNDDFDDLPFDGDEILITGQPICNINDDNIFRLNNDARVYK